MSKMSYEQLDSVFESLRQERLLVQKKTFTKWANVHLQKYGLEINDLFQDLGDGVRLMKLLESLTGEKLGKPTKGSSRIKKIENVSRCLMFLHSNKMRLENISSEDIVDGKPHLILGLIWTIILRCEISSNAPNNEDLVGIAPTPEPTQNHPAQKIAKESLLLWCQTKTNGYPKVHVKDFHRSWRDGLAFNALIHSHIPTLLDFDSLKQEEHIANLDNAFSLASKHIGIPRLLDPEDVDTNNPDEKSIMVYVSTFCKGLANVRKGLTGGKRIANVLTQVLESDRLKTQYCEAARDLLEGIKAKVDHFAGQNKLESLENIQQEIQKFKIYRSTDKLKQSEKRNEVEALFFSIQMKRLGNVWIPPEVSPATIEKAWSELQRAEHEHEIQIRKELKNQERLENLAYKFETKRSVREGYMEEIKKILTDPNYGASIKQSDATFKKHEAIRTGIEAREIMMQDLFKIADVLIESNYRRKDHILEWKQATQEKWNYVLRLLKAFDEKFLSLRQVMSSLQEMDSVLEEMQQLQREVENDAEPLDIESSLKNHEIKEVQIASLGEAVYRFERKVDRCKESTLLQNHVKKLKSTHNSLTEASSRRRKLLEAQLKAKERKEIIEEIMAWIFEKKLYYTSEITCKDLANSLLIHKKYKALASEMAIQKDLVERLNEDKVRNAFSELECLWKRQEQYNTLAVDAYKYKSDADECTSWISENAYLLSTLDYGPDELTSEALLRRHVHAETKIIAYSSEIKDLRVQSDHLCNSLSKFFKELHQKLTTHNKDLVNYVIECDSEIEQAKGTVLSAEYISKRQKLIEKSYKELQDQCQRRKTGLQYHCMYFNFKDRCDEVEKWMRDKESMIDSNDFGESAEDIEHNYEKFITDMVAHGLLIDELASTVAQLEKEKAEQSNTAKMLLVDIRRRWQHLNELTRIKEKNLKGFTSVLVAQRMCEESISNLNEAIHTEAVDSIRDINSFEELRRQQKAIDREKMVLEDRIKQAIVLSENVAVAYPDQKDTMEHRVKTLEENWQQYLIKLKDRKFNLEKMAGFQIFKADANSLLEWSNAVQCKLKIREKISDVEVAESIAKDNKDLGHQIEMQNDRFVKTEELGVKLASVHPEVQPLMEQMSGAWKTIQELWKIKEAWLCENLCVQVFDREANSLQSLCTNQNSLLEVANLGENLSDVESLLRNHETFGDTLHAQTNRFLAFYDMAEKLIASKHEQQQYIHKRQKEIEALREGVLERAATRKLRLEQEFHLQGFKFDSQEMSTWIAEKNKRALKLLHCGSNVKLSSKLKRLETLESELAANHNRLQKVYVRGETLLEECSFAAVEIEKYLEDLENAWNVLCERLEINRQNLHRDQELKSFYLSIESVEKKIAVLKRSVESSPITNDPRSIKNSLKNQEIMEQEQEKAEEKVTSLVQQGNILIEEYDSDERSISKETKRVTQKLEAIAQPLLERREKLETCLKFNQFKSELERELMWISDQKILLSADTPCQTLLDAQKLHKKVENLEVTLECHEQSVKSLSKEALVLVAEKECDIDITQTCEEMQEGFNKLLELFHEKKEKATFNLKSQMFYSEANEIDAWIQEKKELLSNTDCGKDEDMVIKLLTKQKDIELEIDSYKGLVEELVIQAECLIELNSSNSKIIKNRIEVVQQEMKNIQNLCSIRRQILVDSKTEKEFESETDELRSWIQEQMNCAKSDDYGEDYEHVIMLHANFEFFRVRVEAGSKRILLYEDFATKLINGKCAFIEKVKESLDLLSARWSELLECIEARAFKLEAAAEIHRYHRDVTDILGRIHNYYQVLPNDLGSTLAQAQQLAKKHDATENELLGIEAQVHLLLEDAQKLQEAYPGGNEEHIQTQLSLVIENWNLLQKKVAARKSNLIASQQIHKFLSLVKDEESWSKQLCFELESDNIPRDIEQLSKQHQLTETDIETRLSNYESLKNDGLSLLIYNLFQKQINEKLEALSQIKQRIQKVWDARCELIKRAITVISFFNDAKQIQATIATKEVQLCGSQTKETVEDLESVLKKHLEFQKNISVQGEKFSIWEAQGKHLLKQHVPESERIQKKLDDLSNRRKRLLNFNTERCETLANSLQLAKFKRDTIEVETWIQDKKTKLRGLLKDSNQLSADEKIKCLQKQQTIQAEIEAHECIIQRIIQQKKEILQIGEELKVRVELILENWNEMKRKADRMGSDLKEAQDILVIHDYFEKAEKWIKEKELLIQRNESGKDYEHCVSLLAKLEDNSLTKVDDDFMKAMKQLAEKLSRKENNSSVYVRFERISEKCNYLKSEMILYRKKLNAALEIHSFLKDVDDTIDRIREKDMILCTKEDIPELEVAEMKLRKLDAIEKDSTAIEKRIKEQCITGNMLSECHELSAGKISDKINQVEREWDELKKQLSEKKKQLHAVYISLKFVKDVDNMERIVNGSITEIEYGDLPTDSADAISFLQAHNDYKAHILACQEKINELEARGEIVLRTPGVLYEEVARSLRFLSQMHRSLDISWDFRLQQLTQHRDVQIFTERAKQIETWFASKEAFLANKDFGDSLSSVEALLRKHESFEKSCYAYFDKIQELESLATELGREEDCKEIERWFENICQRRDRLLAASEERKKLLMESKVFQQLLLEIYEVFNWINEKLQVVSEDPYRDSKNILSKTQKHATLEAEILSNHSRVVSITTQADELVKEDHFASDEIKQHVQNLEDKWQKLMESTNNQKSKLNDAYTALKYSQKVEDISNSLDEVESQLNVERCTFNIVSIQEEIENMKCLEKDLEEIGRKIQILKEASEMFKHSTKEELLYTFNSTQERYHGLENAMERKFEKLLEDHSFAGLEKDVNDEMSWIEDNIAICQSEEYFNDVISVQVLQKKLQALETEMVSRQPLINSIVERGSRMNNPSAEMKVKLLENRFCELEDSVSLRRLRLSDALEAQTYYFEVAQAEIWIKEKLAQIASCNYGKDVFSIQEVKKKMATIEATSNGYKSNISAIEEFCSKLEGRGHYDSRNIRMKQEELNANYEELTYSVLKKIAVLREEEEYFVFQRDVNSVMSQLKRMSTIANSTEVGRDAEHVESLLQKLELFRFQLRNYEKTVKELQNRATALMEGGHFESYEIKQLLTDLEDTWLECDYSAETRYKVLEQAKTIHSFNKSADETICWIHEKDVALSSDNFGHDLQSIQTLLKHHETLEGDLKAIQEQVEALKEEAASLALQFPNSDYSLQEKLNIVKGELGQCIEKAVERKQKLHQAEQIQSYFDELRDFHSWIREMSALIMRTDLPQDIAACDALLAQHDGYKSDIDAQVRLFESFEARGQEIIKNGHFMSEEINEKLKNLKFSFDELLILWQERKLIHEQNLDLQLFKKKLMELETWLQSQEHYLSEEDGRSLTEIDYLIRKHEQFEQKLNLYETKFQELQRTTKIEEEKRNNLEKEQKRRSEEEKLLEQKRIEELKKKEEKLMEERRKERAETDVLQNVESYEDFDFRDNLPPNEQKFKRIGSRSYPDQSQEIARPETPVIPGKKFSVVPSSPPTTAEGFLERKQEVLSGGKRSNYRGWKSYYTVLCGQLLCFFKDKKSLLLQNAAKAPINILGAKCSNPNDYHKKKYVFRLEPTDKSSFLFEAPNQIKRDEWVKKINFTASLPPSKQLMNVFGEVEGAKTSKAGGKSFEGKPQRELTATKEYGEIANPEEDLYHDIQHSIDHGSNPLYVDPNELSHRRFTAVSYEEEEDLQSARSSFSNQSSYRTALASTSSISTLQDEHAECSEDDIIHSMPEPVTRTESELSVTQKQHEPLTQHMSLPRETTPKRTHRRRIWNAFSLRRNNT